MNTIKSILKKPQTTEQVVQSTIKIMRRITFNQNVRVRTLKSKEDISDVEDSVEKINNFVKKDNDNDKNLDQQNTESTKEKLQTTETPVTKSKPINIASKEEDSIKAVAKALILEAEVVQLDQVIETLVEVLEVAKESVQADAKADAAITEEEKAEHKEKKAVEELKEANNRGLVTVELQCNVIDKILAANQAYNRSQKAIIEATKKAEKSLEALSKAFEVLAKAFEAERVDLISLFTPTAEVDTKEKLVKTFKALIKASKTKNADIRFFYSPLVETAVETKKVKIFKALEQILEEDLKSLFVSAVKAPTKEEKVKILNILAKSVADYAERDDYLEVDYSTEEDHSLMLSYEPKLSGNYLSFGYDDTIEN